MKKRFIFCLIEDKKAMLSFTTGATQTMFRPDNGTLHFCGFQVLAPQIFWSPAHCPPVARTAMLDGWQARLKGLLEEKPLTFAPCELFDLSFQGVHVVAEGEGERESQPYGLTTGHHLGKPLPPDNQITAQSTVESSANADCRK
uniref:Flavodoxin-like fold domain-containing protein n=1 Tax=Labrus bergylta TaxID=56723 RepID=A0A3Q3EPH4_9LABR